MTVEILISTLNEGIKRTPGVLLPVMPGVSYLIIHQIDNNNTYTYPEELLRDDVRIIQQQGRGLTKSRNVAINHARGTICVIADDDITYTKDYIRNIREFYRENDADIACFKIQTNPGEPEYKAYPAKQQRLGSPLQYRPSSVEITFKLYSIRKNSLSFDERFGLGSWLKGGEEAFFIGDAIKKQMRVFFVPEYIVNHKYESTSKTLHRYDKSNVVLRGAMDARMNGIIALLKSFLYVIKYAKKLQNHGKNPFLYIKERLSGAIYILKTPKNS